MGSQMLGTMNIVKYMFSYSTGERDTAPNVLIDNFCFPIGNSESRSLTLLVR